MKLANRGEADIKKSLCQNAAFLCTKISLIPMFSYMRSLYTDRISSEKIFSELLLPSSQCPWCTAKCTISLGKNEIYPISIHRGYNKLHLEPGVNHWPMSGSAEVIVQVQSRRSRCRCAGCVQRCRHRFRGADAEVQEQEAGGGAAGAGGDAGAE